MEKAATDARELSAPEDSVSGAGLIPDEVARFVSAYIDSVAEIEALFLLRNAAPQSWNVTNLARRLYIDERQTGEILRRLTAKGLLSENGDAEATYSYAPVSLELRETIDRLASVYASRLVPVTNLIHAKPKSRVQEFADAFRVRKED
jgi:hypothetical protein